jgi:RNA-directed DNA polymerase
MEGRGDMTKAPRSLQDLRRRISVKAKAEPSWCFWGLYVHVCQRETRRAASQLAKANHGAPGIDGGTFAAIEGRGGDAFLAQLQDELVPRTYPPMRVRQKASPKEGGKGLRTLSMPTIRERVVQGALTLILEPICAADFQPGAYGYRPKRAAHDAVGRVAEAMVQDKTRVIDGDLRAYCDTIQPHLV